MIVLNLADLLVLSGIVLLLVGAFFLVRRLKNRSGVASVATDAAPGGIYQSIVERQSDLICRWKPDGTFIWANATYCEFIGQSAEALAGNNLKEVVGPEARKRLLDTIRGLSGGQSTVKTLTKYSRGSSDVWLEWICTGIADADGQVHEIQSVARDVSGRMVALKALESSESRFRGFVENTSDWVWEIDREGRAVYNNSQVRNILGYEPRDLLHLHWSELAHEDDLPITHARVDDAYRTGTGWRRMITRLRHRDGSYRYLESTADPIVTDAGEVVGFRGIDRDATFETLMAKISADLLGRTAAELDRNILAALEDIGLCYGLERIAYYWLDDGIARIGHYWSSVEGVTAAKAFEPGKALPTAFRTLSEGLSFKFENRDQLPEGSPERQFMVDRGITSSLAVPLFRESVLVGYAVFSMLTRERAWSEHTESDLRHLSDKISAAYSLSQLTQDALRRERDRMQSEALAGMGSFSYYPVAGSGPFPEGWRTYFSDVQCALFEVKPEDASHELLMSRVHEADRSAVLSEMSRLVAGSPDIEVGYRVVNPSGRVLHLSNRTRADRDKDGRIVRVIGFNLDVTEQVSREASLQVAIGEIRELRDRLEEENVQLRETVRSIAAFEHIVGESEALRACLDLARKAAPTDVPVLILGETGTGKELVAKAIHNLSLRKDEPLVALNCSALPAELVESVLFGHERGAFTGATETRKGRFEIADGGTLFLDEIAEMPLELQGKLLRVLQDGSFDKVGSTKTRRADVRLIAATNRDLERAVREGSFRADLYYRLNTITIDLPPLRERKDDIPLLAHHFVMKHGPRLRKEVDSISADGLAMLQARDWPGNVRELEHFIERALISTQGSVLRLRRAETGRDGAESGTAGSLELVSADLRSVERRHILDVLQDTNWTISGDSGAAARLDLPPSTLRSKMKRLGIDRRV